MKKKIFGMLLILCTFVCMLAFTFSVDAWSGSGTANDPYVISSAADLTTFNNNTAYWSKHVKLAANITAATAPICNASPYFTGTFDGGGFTITYSSTATRGSLFGYAGRGATIKDLTVKASVNSTGNDCGGIVGVGMGSLTISGCTVNVQTNASIKGAQNVGGVVGRWRTAENSTDAPGSKAVLNISGVTVNASVSGTSSRVGGIVGYINYHKGLYTTDIDIAGTVSGAVTGTSEHVGGAVGLLHITSGANAAHTGTVDINVTTTGSTSAVSGSTQNVGGIVGYAYFQNTAGTITLNVAGSNAKPVSASTTHVGGIIGNLSISNSGGTVTAKVSANSTGNISAEGVNAGGAVGYANIANSGGTANFEITSDNKGNIKGGGAGAGGVVGRLELSGAGSSTVKIGTDNKAAYNGSGTIEATEDVGGVVGYLIYNKANAAVSIYAGQDGSNATVRTNNNNNAGGVVGLLDVKATGTVNFTYGTNSRSSNTGTVTSKVDNAGGIIGGLTFNTSVNGAVINIKGTSGTDKSLITRGKITAENNAGGIVGLIKFEGSAKNNSVNFDYCDSGDANGTPTITANKANAGGIVGSITVESTAGTGNSVSISNVLNKGTVKAPSYAGGIVGLSSSAKSSSISIGGTNNGTVNATGTGAGGIIGGLDVEVASTVTIAGTSSGAVEGATSVGGYLGVANLSGEAELNFTSLTNGANVTATVANAGGIVGHINVLSGSSANVTVSMCTNNGAVEAPTAVGGMVGRYESKSTASKVTIEKCRNTAAIQATTGAESRAGGIVGLFIHRVTGIADQSVISNCWNSGTVTGGGWAVGGIAGATYVNTVNKLLIQHCLNSAAITTNVAHTQARVGGIVGDYLADTSLDALYTIKYCYNLADISAPNATGDNRRIGNIIGRSHSNEWGTYITDVYYKHQVANGNGVGTLLKEYDYVTKNNNDIKANWVYAEYDDEIELKYFHTTLGRHSTAPNFRMETVNGVCYFYCASINCSDTQIYPSRNASTAAGPTIYVSASGYTAATVPHPMDLGSATYPCATLELANYCVDRNKQCGVGATTISVAGTVSVPSCYHLPAATSGTMTVTGNGSGVLKFDNKSIYQGTKHFHIDGPALIQNITVQAVDKAGIYFYADNHNLTMGDGITMTGVWDYYVEDYHGKVDENHEDEFDFAGARVYVAGGYSLNEWLHENLSEADISKFNGYVKTLSSYLSEGKTGAPFTDDANLENLKAFVNELAAAAPNAPAVNSNITVRSGQYRAISGWHYDFCFYERGTGIYEELNYNVPVTGTANVTVGSANSGDLQVTHLSPFGSDYQSFGENATANVTVDGNVIVWDYNIGAQVKRMTLRQSGIGDEIGQNCYPLITNLRLSGNIAGPADSVVVDDIKPLSEYYWGFNATSSNDFAVLGNITVDNETEAIKDAHAFLGHGSYCNNANCTAGPATFIENYVHRSMVLGRCTCGGAPVASNDNLPATCISYALNRMVCADCGEYKSATVPSTVLNPNYHIQKMSLEWINNMSRTQAGVSVTSGGECRCFSPRTSNITSNGTFYVNETNYTGNADYYYPGIGSREVPFNDFMTAYRVAKAYVSDGGEATVVIIDNASLAVDEANTKLPHYGDFAADMESVGNVVIQGDGSDSTLLFRNETEDSVLRLTGDVEFKNMKLKVENPTVNGNPARIRIFARNNKLVMGEGLNMPDAYTDVNNTINNNFMVFGGFYSAPGVVMNTDVTVRSGQYYYIGAWNNQATQSEVTGTGNLTVGASGNDTLLTRFLSTYGVGSEKTRDTVSNMYIVGKVEAESFEPTAQNGKTDTSVGATSIGNRVANIYITSTADIDIENVHMNNEPLTGHYTVNVFVENSATNPSIDTVHMLCGHDKGLKDIDGKTNYRHINTYHPICERENCPYGTSHSFSYLNQPAIVNGVASDVEVNVYDMARPAPVIEYKVYAETDSGFYYPENRHIYDPLGGVVRFLFAIEATSENCELDPDYVKDMVEESFVRYLFTNVSKDSESNIAGTSISGTATHFRADVYDIPMNSPETYYAVGVVKLKDGTVRYSDITPATVKWERAIAYYRDVVGGGVEA